MKLLFYLSFTILLFSFTAFAQNASVNFEGQIVCCGECWAEADWKAGFSYSVSF